MARRTFEVIDVVEILAHWYAGRSKAGGRQLGRGPLDGGQVRGTGSSCRHLARRPHYQRRAVAGHGAGVVPGMAGTRFSQPTWPRSTATEEDRGPGGRGAGLGDPPAPSRQGGPGNKRGQPAPLLAGAFC